MLTFSIGTVNGILISANFGTTTTFTEPGDVSVYFPALCTDFEHAEGETTFTGSAFLPGGFYHAFALFGGSSFSTTLTDDLGAVVSLTVVSGSFDTAASTGSAHLTGFSSVSIGDLTGVSLAIDLVDMSLLGTSGMTGTISGAATLLPMDSTVSAEARPFSLAVGVPCS